ncbi:Ada metal-binding domain-containing protein [Gymnodinialimonas hymeniacidonis]
MLRGTETWCRPFVTSFRAQGHENLQSRHVPSLAREEGYRPCAGCRI